MSTNWADYLILVYSVPFWEAPTELLHVWVPSTREAQLRRIVSQAELETPGPDLSLRRQV